MAHRPEEWRRTMRTGRAQEPTRRDPYHGWTTLR